MQGRSFCTISVIVGASKIDLYDFFPGDLYDILKNFFRNYNEKFGAFVKEEYQ